METGVVMIVEGKTDKERLLRILDEPVTIICTFGTFSEEKAERLHEQIDEAEEIYIFTDEDDSGKKLRSQLRQEFPNATHLHTKKIFAEVADTPLDELAEILEKAGFAIK
ncbi:toprim domain-containing protein [Brevibacillus dissolubilis]|uniref:toprim domain-containing protein n=1 Tax=Brevibacillus dissolubilis TaxID=1844116 RepID=UPI0011169087|nr:toprim domain-containing protein [Brevibacillus dissolubilis]